MAGNFVDHFLFALKSPKANNDECYFLETDFGKIRIYDNQQNKPTIINVPDGPNVIEHQMSLIKELSKNFRVVCFEYPGMGFSYPNKGFNYSFKHGAGLLFEVMDQLKISIASLLFSCSNGFYAMQAVKENPDRFTHLFLSQTPSLDSMMKWSQSSIPFILNIPILGQLCNSMIAKKMVEIWYKSALPKQHPDLQSYTSIAKQSLSNGGCFCLSSLVQGLKKDKDTAISISKVPTTLIWGAKDYSHRMTDKNTIFEHIRQCEIIEFEACGHFPELENNEKVVRLIGERLGE